ncbi:unnamed protein product [Blepharisma stoltei]|uniref:Uncharacterized protein n=1 Tax=Blepharisma stoltei TaxID=1481888 RepID=A0AAU9I9P0_9CILI|nr:unnamed protein product [Blepharisma stoltei]
MVKRISIKRLLSLKYKNSFSILHMQTINRIWVGKAKFYNCLVKIAVDFHMTIFEIFFFSLILKSAKIRKEEFFTIAAWLVKCVTTHDGFLYQSVANKLVKNLKAVTLGWILKFTLGLQLRISTMPGILIYSQDFGISLQSIQFFEIKVNQFLSRLAQKIAAEITEEVLFLVT